MHKTCRFAHTPIQSRRGTHPLTVLNIRKGISVNSYYTRPCWGSHQGSVFKTIFSAPLKKYFFAKRLKTVSSFCNKQTGSAPGVSSVIKRWRASVLKMEKGHASMTACGIKTSINDSLNLPLKCFTSSSCRNWNVSAAHSGLTSKCTVTHFKNRNRRQKFKIIMNFVR